MGELDQMASSVVKSDVYGAGPRTERAMGCYITSCADADLFAYCAYDHIVMRKISEPHKCKVFRGHSEPTCIRISPNKMFAVSGDAHGFIKIWNLENPEIIRYEGQLLAGPIRDVAWSPDSQRVLAVGEGREEYAVVVMAEGGSKIGTVSGFVQGCISCDFRPDRPFKMALISNDRSIAFWKGPPLKKEWQKEEMDILARQVRYSPDGKYFITVGSGKCLIYDGMSGERVKELPVEHKGTITSCAWSPDSKSLITSCCDQTVKLWDIETCTSTTTFTFGEDAMENQQLGCTWAGDKMITISFNGNLNFLDPENPAQPSLVIPGLARTVEGLAFCSGASAFYAGTSMDGICKVVSFVPGVGAVGLVTGDAPVQCITGLAACD